MKTTAMIFAGALLATAAPALALDTFNLTYEDAGVENSTATFTTKGVETFDALPTGFNTFTTDFGTMGAFTGSYTGVQINSADQYGGAGGMGNYAVAFPGTPYTVTLTADPVKVPGGVNYFGYYLSALDNGNLVQFFRGGTLVGQLDPAGVLARIGNKPAYFGNPDAPFQGQNSAQPYAFINFFDTNGTFDTVTFTQTQGGGYELDNHTVGFYTAISGNTVPEPAAWALMVAGFGLVGSALRRRVVAVAA